MMVEEEKKKPHIASNSIYIHIHTELQNSNKLK